MNGFWLVGAPLGWALAWALNVALSRGARPAVSRLLVPLVFGLSVIFLWEALVRGFGVPGVILPPPSAVAETLVRARATLWGDFVQTAVMGGLSGWAIGCAAGILVAIAVDRSPFLRSGLLPIGNFVAALPIVGVAPILVSWFGFGWQSKAAVVVSMVFFPVLLSTVAGMSAVDRMQRDLMQTYAAGYRQRLRLLYLPAAMPFIFNGLKIAATLALIGAIVAEYFGSPTRGMGFRISTEVGRMGMDMVWAEIAVAALAGSLFYGFLALLERRVTFWHPSQR